ncbi:PepSY-associated TM helix domain-containing protein [Galbibacter sp. PAP.153]|uniref:PepSY-associated TM helix domain-containing protein n=1 Tax=Galbibacter sp. PAP.153 TaxID=3104623 RepID=UPI00300820C0
MDTAKIYIPHIKPTGLTYGSKKGAAAVGYSYFKDDKQYFSVVFLNPYTGAFIKKQQPIGGNEFNFFQFIIDGHRSLWLPYTIGRPIVGICTLIFIILLFTGLIMWWPKKWNKTNLNNSFKVKWNAKFKQLNYDLHNVVGFYALVFSFILAVTGLVWSFDRRN